MDGSLEYSAKEILQQYVSLIDTQLEGLSAKHTNPIALQNVIDNFVGTIDDLYLPKQKFVKAVQSVSPKFILGEGYRNAFDDFFKAIRGDILKLKPGEAAPTTITPDKLKELVEEHRAYLEQINKAGLAWQEKWEENLRRAQQYARLALENPEYARLAIDGQLAFLRIPEAIRPFVASDVIVDIQKVLKGKLLDQKLPQTQKRLTVVDIETISGNSIKRLQQQYNISLGLPKNVSPQLVRSIQQINEAQGVTIASLAQLPYAAVVKETSWIAAVVQFQKEVLFNIKSPELEKLSATTAVSLTDSWVQHGGAGFNQPDQLNLYLSDLNIRLQASGIFLNPVQLSGLIGEHMPVFRALQLLATSGRAGELLGHIERAGKELLEAPAVRSEKKPVQGSTTPLLSVPLVSGLLKLPQLTFLAQAFSAPLRVLNNFSLPNLLNRARTGFGLAPMLKRGIFAQWWFWLIVVFLLIVFSGIIPGSDDVISDITNAFIYQGKSQIEFGGTHLASGSCPIVKDPKIILGSYQGLTAGHGSLRYWGGGTATYSIPIVGMYSPGCLLPGLCPYYGFAVDVNSNSEKLAEVSVPYVCPAGEACIDSEIVWTVQTTFFNCQGGSTATEADCRKQKWGWGTILTATANGHSWQLYLNHIDTQLPVGSTYTTVGNNLVARLYQGDMNNPHVHIELNMDGVPLRPDFLCDGTGGGGPIPGPAPLITGDCKAENLTVFGSEDQNASCICSQESGGGNVHATNQGCLVGASREYSVGLFQINLLVHTPVELIQQITNLDPTAPETANISWINSLGETKTATIPFRGRCTAAFNWPGGTSCSLRNQQIFDLCRNHFYDSENNKNYAQQLQSSSGWGPWSTHTACGL